MGSADRACIPSFIKIGSGIQKLIRGIIMLLIWTNSKEDEMGRACSTHGEKRNA
jgi:hypothetical protein